MVRTVSFSYFLLFYPFPDIDAFWCLSSKWLLKSSWHKKKLLLMSNFSICHNDLNPFFNYQTIIYWDFLYFGYYKFKGVSCRFAVCGKGLKWKWAESCYEGSWCICIVLRWISLCIHKVKSKSSLSAHILYYLMWKSLIHVLSKLLWKWRHQKKKVDLRPYRDKLSII